jgi:hypothetical protein
VSIFEEPVVCEDERPRRAALVGHPTLNGLDFVEVDAVDLALLHVHFLNDLPADAYGLEDEPDRISVEGGTRIVGVRVLEADRIDERQLDVRVDRVGDFSPYVLEIEADELDPRFSRLVFSFRAGCPVDVAPTRGDDVAAPGPTPALDYLAKDYTSFRQLLLDLVPQLNPRFTERNPADLGIALVELLAYAGDRLSYFQDAVANEAYLETARRRISVRRLARLVDYRVRDGANASTHLHVQVAVGVAGAQLLPARTPAVTRIVAPLRNQGQPPGVAIPAFRITAETLETDPALAGAAVFETQRDLECFEANNEIFLHTWGNEECWLPEGATEAWLFAAPGGSSTVVRPQLEAGDLLLLEEVRGPATGLAADADPARRQVVELTEVDATATDDLFSATLLDGELQLRDGAAALPLLRVRWRREDALEAPFCLSRRDVDLGLLRDLTRARGNVVPADHGLTTLEAHALPAPADERLRLRLDRGPLTLVGGARPAIELDVLFAGGDSERWRPVPDLLDSPPFAQEFVAEPGDDGRAVLRFGDGEYGRSIAGATAITATYRVGNGRAGNVGAEAIVHVAPPSAVPTGWIRSVRNPLPATGGSDPEPLEQVRRRAPEAFRAKQLRAVTAADWEAAVRETPDVQGAVAHFRWTGSWYAVVIGIDPRLPADLVTGPDGRIRLHPDFERRTRARLERYRLAGYDLQLLAPTFVPLELELELCVAPGYFRSDVAAAVAEALSTRTLRGGRRGFFHPENMTFGRPVHLSRIYAAVEAVEGVDTAVVRVFRRYGRDDAGELEAGVLPLERGEIAQLENDPNFLEHGILRIVALGGKA